MRDYLVFAAVFGLLPFILKRPAVGVMAFTWISLMNPHRLTYGAAYNFQFAALLAGVTFIGIIATKRPKRFLITPAAILLILFFAWTNLTILFALEPDPAWKEWDRVMKTFIATLCAIYLLEGEKEVKAFAAVVGLSIGFYGFKGGLFTVATAGNGHVLGPEGTYIGDNNTLALSLVTVTPIIWYLRLHASNKWLRTGLTFLTFLTVIAIVGTYSRGALLGGSAMIFLLWLKSREKLRYGLVFLLIIPVVFMLMPEKWFSRMESIDNYQQDASAMGRVNAWMFAINVAKDNFMGGGYGVFTPKSFVIYAPDPLDYHVAHSIYFQVLGEHGIVGLTLYLLLMASAWRSGSRIIKRCQGKQELRWASDLAAMLQVSIVGFAVGGAFLSLAYYDLYFDIIALLVLVEKSITPPRKGIAGQSLSTSGQARPE